MFKMQSSFIFCLECDSDSKVDTGIVRRACFCLDASFSRFGYRRASQCNISIV